MEALDVAFIAALVWVVCNGLDTLGVVFANRNTQILVAVGWVAAWATAISVIVEHFS